MRLRVFNACATASREVDDDVDDDDDECGANASHGAIDARRRMDATVFMVSVFLVGEGGNDDGCVAVACDDIILRYTIRR
jgi:hypothetical protein